MAEERELVLQSVGEGLNSKGFQVFESLASPDLGSQYERYRVFLDCLFDELSLDLGVLFDRFSPFGLLFPREQKLKEFLALLYDPELKSLWREDETIGWIYQYFNDEAERKKMREESSAPRNSRELAVRNQFFTPRYVVEFLVDNTLGRLWFEMQQGQTALREECDYMVRRPDEVYFDRPWSEECKAAQRWLETGEGAMPEFTILGSTINCYGISGRPGEASDLWVEERLELLNQDGLEAARKFTVAEILSMLGCIVQKDRFCEGMIKTLHGELKWMMTALRERIEAAHRPDRSQEQLLRDPIFVPWRPLKDPREIRMLDPACGSMHFGLYASDLFETIYAEAWDFARDIGDDIVPFGLEAFGPFLTFAASFATREAFIKEVPRLTIEHNIHGIDIDPRATQIAGLSLWLRAHRAWQSVGVKPADRPRITRSNLVCAEPMPGEKELLREFVEGAFPAGERPAFVFLLEKIFDYMTLAGEAGSLLRIEEEIRTAIADAKQLWKQGPKAEQALLFSEPGKKAGQGEMRLDLSGITDEQFFERAEQRIYDALEAYAEQAENGGGFQRRLFANDAAQGFAFIDLCRKRYDVVVMNPPFGNPPDSVASMLSPDAANNVYPAFVLRGAEISDGFVGAITDRTFVVQQSFGKFRTRLTSDLGLIALAELGWGVLDGADVQVATYVVRKGSERVHLFVSLSGDDGEPAEQLRGVIADIKWTPLSRELIRKLPSSAFAHTLPTAYLTHLEAQSALRDFATLPRGLGSNDANRTYKAWYEVPIDSIGAGKTYRSLCNGGSFSPFFRDDAGVAEWLRSDGKLLVEEGYSETNKAYDQKGNPLYFSPGLSFPKQASSYNVAALPEDAIPTREGKGIVPNHEADRLSLLAYLNSSYARYFVEATNGLHKQSGPVGMTPVPSFSPAARTVLGTLALTAWRSIAESYVLDEASRIFIRLASPADLEHLRGADISELCKQIDSVVFDEVGVEESDREVISASARFDAAYFRPETVDAFSYALGCVFGRWDIRYGTGERPTPELRDPFASLPVCPPGMLQGADGLPLSPEAGRRLHAAGQYPLDVAWDGILVDDPEHPLDLERRVNAALQVLWQERADGLEHEACALLCVPSLREWFRRPTGFFADHLRRYSKSRRQAPIYWPLSIASGGYTLWLYYPRLTDQTLYRAVTDFVKPKLDAVSADAARCRLSVIGYQGGGDSAPNNGQPISNNRETATQRAQLQQLTDFQTELQEFHDELLRVARLPWKPNLNDGVLITASPLWKLFRLPKWQKDLKVCWEELAADDYDWAHLAYSIWPDRVREKCKMDRSLAMAHGLEDICEVAAPKPKATKAKKAGKDATTPELPARPAPRAVALPARAPQTVRVEVTAPTPIDQTDRNEVLCVIRQLFSSGGTRDRETAMREVAQALGFQRLGSHVREVLNKDFLTAVRRGILANDDGLLKLLVGDVRDYEREFQKENFLSAIGRAWIEREDAIRLFARWLGYARTGPVIEDTARSLINGLLREGRLEKDGDRIRRVS